MRHLFPHYPKQLVLFLDGAVAYCHILRYFGACFAEQSTAYVLRGEERIFCWVKPGESVDWIEAAE